MSSPYVLPSFIAIPMPFLGSLMSQAEGWPWVFLVAGSLLSISGVMYMVLLQEAPSESVRTGSGEAKRQRWLKPAMLFSPFGAILGIYALIGFGQGITGPFMALYFTKFLGSTVEFFGVLSSIEMASVGLLSFVSGKLVDRFGALRTMGLSFGGEACLVTAMIFVRNILLAGVFYEAWGALDWFDLTAPAVFIGSRVGKERRATAISTFGVATKIPGLAAPGIGGLLFSRYPPIILMTYALIVTTSALLVWGLEKTMVLPSSKAASS